MSKEKWTEAGEAVTALILDIFRLNSRLLLTGDRLVADLGLTSARWQVLGSIAYAEQPQTVAWHARSMGHHRQGIQRIVNELKAEEIIEFKANPQHKRAHLVLLTPKGQDLFDAAIERQIPWVNALSSDVKPADLEATRRVVHQLKTRLEQD
ncbi:MAG: MarR family transcriptional regulator [Roseibium sp.]|uniref:MarR family winged helix-turn-helix transcriptional regulator n=1 Tax=Roseibium sp. TaxID=1936156 RepID=UPI002632F69D|nr:MarR family transcriptional regulator [Roseibium sp.]MCV0425276.1 MarR family transcriptional regulator [Roseibium sp.]